MKQSEILIREHLNKPEFFRLDLREETDSTNTVVKRKGIEGEPEGYLCVADHQTAGKGRLGRTFVSPDSGLYMSLLLRPAMSAADTLRITPAAAVAAAEAITALCGRPAEIKWVNDIYMGGRKICGILTESVLSQDGDGIALAVLGIGVNIALPKDGFPAEIEAIAGAIYPYGEAPEGFRERLCAEIWNRFLPYYADLKSPELLKRYRELSFLPGKRVRVIETTSDPSRYRIATVDGITDDYGLAVTFDDGTRKVLATGEVSLKLTD